MAIIAEKYLLSLINKENIARNTYSFYFERPAKFEYLPGQFMRLVLDLPATADRGNGRFFSIASSPTESNHLMITVRIKESIFKKTLLGLKPGSKINIAAPYGAFVLKPEEAGRRVLIAGGIGITPFRSMIRYVADKKLENIPITLISSSSVPEDIVYKKELNEIQENSNWFKIVETITKPELAATPWEGNIGRINSQFIKQHVPDIFSSIFYAAGPPPMVDAMDGLLKSLGVDVLKIRKEKFTGY